MKKHTQEKHSDLLTVDVVIVGGGFAGIRTALSLAKKDSSRDIVLISKEDNFVYYPAMYRYVAGAPDTHILFSLEEIFNKYSNVHIVHDEVIQTNVAEKHVVCASGAEYRGEYLILAMGSESNYFSIEGVDEVSFNFKSREAGLRLRTRIMSLFAQHIECDTPEMLVALHFVIVGGGPSGVELAGQLASFSKQLAQLHGLDESLITIDLVERNNRVLNRMPKEVSVAVQRRLRILGVNILLNRSLEKSESWTVFLTDMKLGAKTVIWTAGVKPVPASQNIEAFKYSKRKTIEVEDDGSVKGHKNVFVLGDIAAAPNSGLAQGALDQAQHTAQMITNDRKGKRRQVSQKKEVFHVVPVGPKWAVFQYKGILFFGSIAWLMRWVADIRFYLSILPIRKVWQRLRSPWALANKDVVKHKKETL